MAKSYQLPANDYLISLFAPKDLGDDIGYVGYVYGVVVVHVGGEVGVGLDIEQVVDECCNIGGIHIVVHIHITFYKIAFHHSIEFFPRPTFVGAEAALWHIKRAFRECGA